MGQRQGEECAERRVGGTAGARSRRAAVVVVLLLDALWEETRLLAI